jgi:hypothetical protein
MTLEIKRLFDVKSAIIEILLTENPGYNFGVNPKNLCETIKEKYEIDITPIQMGHILKDMGFTDKIRTTNKIYRTIYIDKLMEIKKGIEGTKTFREIYIH